MIYMLGHFAFHTVKFNLYQQDITQLTFYSASRALHRVTSILVTLSDFTNQLNYIMVLRL